MNSTQQDLNSSSRNRTLSLHGVRTHNLKGIDVDLPANSLVVITGVSGAGKSSLAVETLAAEGQRRFIETFPASSRKILERLERPDADSIGPLPPAIILRRSHGRPSRRATPSTLSEVQQTLQQLFAAASEIVCPECQFPVVAHSAASIAQVITTWPDGLRFQVCFARSLGPQEVPDVVASELMEAGFQRVIVAGQTSTLKIPLPMDWPQARVWSVVVDRLQTGKLSNARLLDSLEQALQRGSGACYLIVSDDSATYGKPFKVDDTAGRQAWFHTRPICAGCLREFPVPTPRLFSFHSPQGACPRCQGVGEVSDTVCPKCAGFRLNEQALAVRFHDRNLGEVLALTVTELRKLCNGWMRATDGEAGAEHFDPHAVMSDESGVKSITPPVSPKNNSNRAGIRDVGEETSNVAQPPHPQPLSPEYGGEGSQIPAETHNPMLDPAVSHDVVGSVGVSPNRNRIASQTAALPWLTQLHERLTLMERLGLGYLQLNRSGRTLSSGEIQRLALAATCAVRLVEALYVLDEPAAGLHSREIEQLILIMRELQARRNSVVIVEHSATMIHSADAVIDLGPGSGPEGGRLIHQGSPDSLLNCEESTTAAYLSGRSRVERRAARQPTGWLALRGIQFRVLNNLDVDFPLGVLCVVTGPSGCGKSTLIRETLAPALCAALGQPAPAGISGTFRQLTGAEALRASVYVDQTPPERSGRGNVATAGGLWVEIRAMLAASPEAKVRQFTAGTFSFHNARGGRCTTCEGLGTLAVDLQFLADLQVTCPDCHGTRFQREVLEVKYRGLSVAEILKLTVGQALPFFRGQSRLQRRLKAMKDVGLGYLQLGQPVSSLSGGETQRLQLASQMTTRPVGATLYLLDEPARGLHPAEIQGLVNWFDDLLNEGHSLIVIEHRPELIAVADHVIELGTK